MKNLNSKSSKINGVFSAFLVIGYIVCAYFFSSLANQLTGNKGPLVQVLILVVFGLLLFYATRVGEGKQIKRFSLAVLLLIDLPALYIIIANFFPNFPFSAAINPALAQQTLAAEQGVVQAATTSGPSIILVLACVALGYGLPYTFFSGYEISLEETVEDEVAQENAPVEGGIAADLAEAEETAEATEETTEEAVEETAEAAEEAAEDAEETAEAVEEAVETVDETAEETAEEAVEEEQKEEE